MESSEIIEMLLDDILTKVTGTLPPDEPPAGRVPLPHIQNSSSEESFDGGEEGQTLGSSDSGANFSDYPGTEGETPASSDSGIEQRPGTPRALFDPSQPGKYGGMDL